MVLTDVGDPVSVERLVQKVMERWLAHRRGCSHYGSHVQQRARSPMPGCSHRISEECHE